MRDRQIAFGAFAILVLAQLTGCQPDGQRPTVSLDQARQITAQFQGQGFVPPPRTISDIAAILDQQKPDPAKVAAIVAKADAQPSASLTGVALAQFHFERSNAASQLGRLIEAASDTKLAFEIAERSGMSFGLSRQYLGAWIGYELAVGNDRSGRELSLRRLARETSLPGRVGALAGAISASIALGDLETAKVELLQLQTMVSSIRNDPRSGARDLYESGYIVPNLSGRLALASGQFTEAERFFREAIRLINSSQEISPNVELAMRRLLANAMMRQGRLLEAEIEAREVLLAWLSRTGRFSAFAVTATNALSDILIERGRYSEAERLTRISIETMEQLKIDPSGSGFARVLRLLAKTQSMQDNWADAATTYTDLRKRMGSNPDALRQTFDENQNWGIVSLRTGQAGEAERVMARLVARNVQALGERHWDTAMSRGILGAAKLAQGNATGALTEFDAALPILLQSSSKSNDEESGSVARDNELRMVFEAAMGALARSGRPGAADDAFRLADAVRGQAVERALAQSSARAAAADPALAELVRREQDTQKQIGALQSLLTNVLASAQRDEAVVRTLRTQIDSLRSARATIRQEIERRFPSYAQLIDPRPATVEDTRRALRPGEALIATYVGAEQTFVWAVPQSGAAAFAAVEKGQRAVAETVATLRKALDPKASALGDIPAFDVGMANRLYDELLKPVETGFANATSLLVVPHGALGQLPFGVLVTQTTQLRAERPGEALFANYKDVPFLIRKAAITQLPSVAALVTLRGLPAPSANRRAFLGFGDPWFSLRQAQEARAQSIQTAQVQTRGVLQTHNLPLVRRNEPTTRSVDSAVLAMLPRLPETADEVRAIALALNADPSDVILGSQANERTVKTMDLSNRRVVLFATHGLVPGDLNGLIQPALALSAPNVADVDGDGLLTLDEVLALKLDADWVVLSACNTATGDGAGAEAVSGLGRAFFYAGTRALLVSNWPVETTSARDLTTDLFSRQARDPSLQRAQALRQAMTSLIDGPGYVDPTSRATAFSYAHPLFWAPFSLVGDGGSSQRQMSEAR
jgi:CHAT domain-containing protein/tetratricopeptide (TPR) repeat protein